MPEITSSLFVTKVVERLDRLDRSQIEKLILDLRNEREFLQGVFDRLAEGVVALNQNWAIVWANRSGRRMLGLTRRKRGSEGRIFDLNLDPALLSRLRAYALSGSRNHFDHQEIEIHEPQERILSVTLISDPDTEIRRAAHVLIIEDLTDQRAEQTRRIEAEKTASLSTLTAGVAHEIKNPLNALKIHAQLLKRSALAPENERMKPERHLRSINVILEEIDRLGSVVDQFLTAARPTRPELTSRSLEPLIQKLAGLFKPELDTKDINLFVKFDKGSSEIPMDEPQMMQALMNLLRNSIEAIEAKRGAAEDPEDAEGRIEIRVRGDEKAVHISVSDTGCGIAPEDLQRVKEPYYTTKFSGTGLGLMVVYRVVREHGGAISIQSEVGVGASITLTLPRAIPPARFIIHDPVVEDQKK